MLRGTINGEAGYPCAVCSEVRVVKWGSLFVLVLVVFTMDTAQDMIDLILPAGPKVVIGAHSILDVLLVLVNEEGEIIFLDGSSIYEYELSSHSTYCVAHTGTLVRYGVRV